MQGFKNTFLSFIGKISIDVMHSKVPIKCIPDRKCQVLTNVNNVHLELWGSRQLLFPGKDTIYVGERFINQW